MSNFFCLYLYYWLAVFYFKYGYCKRYTINIEMLVTRYTCLHEWYMNFIKCILAVTCYDNRHEKPRAFNYHQAFTSSSTRLLSASCFWFHLGALPSVILKLLISISFCCYHPQTLNQHQFLLSHNACHLVDDHHGNNCLGVWVWQY